MTLFVDKTKVQGVQEGHDTVGNLKEICIMIGVRMELPEFEYCLYCSPMTLGSSLTSPILFRGIKEIICLRYLVGLLTQ